MKEIAVPVLAILLLVPTQSTYALTVEEITVSVCSVDANRREVCVTAVPGPNVSVQQLVSTCMSHGAHFVCTPRAVVQAGLSLVPVDRD